MDAIKDKILRVKSRAAKDARKSGDGGRPQIVIMRRDVTENGVTNVNNAQGSPAIGSRSGQRSGSGQGSGSQDQNEGTATSRPHLLVHQGSLNSADLTGRGSLSSSDLGIMSYPGSPTTPPSALSALLDPGSFLGVSDLAPRTKSEPDLSTKQLDEFTAGERRRVPLDIIRVMKRLSTAARTDADADSDTDDDSFLAWSDGDSSISSTTLSTLTSPGSIDLDSPPEEAPMTKSHRVALEITNTEESYVGKLKLLDKARTNTEQILGKDVARQMFPFINNIYALHNYNLLPQLKKRMTTWQLNPQIGDIMKTFSPYLKMYADYVKHFDEALRLVETWNSKNDEFSEMLKYLTPEGVTSLDLKLQLQSYMLEPVQRVPRYQLLLKQYLKEIPPDSEERPELEEALSLVTEAAEHFEDMMKHGTQMGELAMIQKQIDCPVSLISSTRRMVQEGRLGLVHATTGRVVQRYIFLFNDLLLLCSENSRFSVHKYKVRAMMEVEGLQVVDDENMDVPFSFHVKSRKKTIELSARDTDDKEQWQEVLRKVINDKMRRKLQQTANVSKRKTVIDSEDRLGKVAPVLVHNSQVSMCMICAVNFSPVKRKHHCRACGVVACNGCSSHNVPLEYDDYKDRRVCDECYMVLEKTAQVTMRPKGGIKEPSIHRGFLLLSTDGGYSWNKRWLQYHHGNKLTVYKAQQDPRPLFQVDLKKCSIDVCLLTATKIKIVRLKSKSKTFLLQAQKRQAADLTQWISALKRTSSISS